MSNSTGRGHLICRLQLLLLISLTVSSLFKYASSSKIIKKHYKKTYMYFKHFLRASKIVLHLFLIFKNVIKILN